MLTSSGTSSLYARMDIGGAWGAETFPLPLQNFTSHVPARKIAEATVGVIGF